MAGAETETEPGGRRNMRILFIRHGDPDYVNDTLTEKGHREAALLAEHIQSLHPGTCYVSPLGRARKTAEYSLKRLGCTAQTLEWLREFPARIDLEQAAEHIAANALYQIEVNHVECVSFDGDMVRALLG